MKVLHIFNSLMPSGAETMLVAARNVLSRERVVVEVVATLPDIGIFADEMRSSELSVYHIPHMRRRWIDLPYMVQMFRFIRENKYDAVQIHPEAWRLTNVLVARLAGVKSIVTTVHNIFAPRGLRFIQRSLRMWMIERLGAKIVAIGDSVCENEIHFGTHPIKIYNWFDLFRFRRSSDNKLRSEYRKELHLSEETKVVAVVGNCNAIKNHPFLIRLLTRLPSQYVVLHVGRENEGLTHERRIADELGVLERIRFVGSRKDVGDLLESADVYVMCSLREGLSIACLEALSKGLPSVVADVPGLRDVAKIVPLCVKAQLDEEEFSRKILEQANLDEGRLLDLRRTTNEVLAQRFSVEKNVRHYVDLWNGVR